MGTYTPNLKFYKPDPAEFVDVDVQLNANWTIADPAVKRLLEYEFTNLPVPDVVGSVDRARFYKIYSNSFMAWFESLGIFYQDPKAFVAPWFHANTIITGGYTEHPDFPTAYRTVKNVSGTTTAEIEWAGAFWLDGSAVDLNLNYTVAAPGEVPAALRPVVTKYFNVWCGNTATDYTFARVLFGNDGRIEFKRYGVDPPAGDERRVELTGIKYNVEVAA